MQILPIASGKGGVGKSLLAANLAIALARSGKRTILADLDLGGSNLHLILGMRGVRNGIGVFINSKDADFNEFILATDHDNLLFIPGDAEVPGIANLGTAQKRKLMRRLRGLDADFLILDLGAGTNYNVMDFFLLSSQGVIVTTPTPTALVNAYLCLKNAMFRLLTTSFKRNSPAGELIRDINKDGDHLQRIYIPDLVEQIERVDPESMEKYKTRVTAFRPRVVMNMLDDPNDADKITRLRRSCKQYLNLDLEHLGVMYRDSLQDIALGARLPIVVYKPNAILSQAIYRIADKMIELSFEDTEFLSWTDTDESFAAAAAEAEIDFGSKIDYVEELLHTGALSHGDLVETVKTQQLEVNQLRAQNALLKSKDSQGRASGFRRAIAMSTTDIKPSDGAIRVRLSEQKMAALITISSGDPLADAATMDEVLSAVQSAGITRGVDDELLRRAADRAGEGEAIDELVFARGRHPSGRGEGRLEMLVTSETGPTGTAPAVSEDESTHQGRIAVVSSGTNIARFRPIDDGTQDGWDVTGSTVHAEAIRPESSDVETGEHVRADPQPDGGFLLVAELDGELFLKKKRFEVRPRTIIGGDVDESNGNVRASGSVVVRGSVRSGHFVVSGGDLHIGRNVEAALLSAEGDIVINHGVRGHGKAVLRTRRSVGLTFAEQTTILAVGNIQARNSLVDCTIKTNGKIRMIGKQCSVVGGFIKTRDGMETINLGSDTGAPTRVDFGQNVLVADQIEREEQEIEKLKMEITGINTTLEKIEAQGKVVNLDELHARKLQAMKLLEKRGLRLFTLREQFEEHFDSKIIVRGSVYPGVVIESHGRSVEIAAETKNVVFSFNPQTGQIVENRMNRGKA